MNKRATPPASRPRWLLAVLAALMAYGCGSSSTPANQAESSSGSTGTLYFKGEVELASNVENQAVALNPGWNAVGFQAEQLTALSANPAIAGAARWNGSSYTTLNFAQADLNSGAGGRQGFFVFANSATSFTYSGNGGPSFVDLTFNGFNLVSFCTSADLPGSALTATQNGQSVPLSAVVLPQFTEIGPGNQYTQVDVSAGGVLKAGRAYWVVANTSNGPVRLNLAAASPSPAASPTASPAPPTVSAPTLTGLSPNSGWTGGTSGVVLTGTGFRGATAVTFGGTEVQFTVVSDTQILAEAPPQDRLNPPATVVPVRVVTPGGTSPAGSGATYTYTEALPPPTAPPTGGGGGGGGGFGTARSLGTGTSPASPSSRFVTVTTTAASTPGATIFVAVSQVGGMAQTSTTCTDNATPIANVYTRDVVTGVGGSHLLHLFRSFNASSLPAGSTITVNCLAISGTSGVAISAFEVAGLTALDQTGAIPTQGPNTAPTVSTGAATTTATEFVLGVFGAYDLAAATAAPTFTPGAGPPAYSALPSTAALSASRRTAVFPLVRTVTATGVQTADGTFGTNSAWDGVIATYR